jgi:tRNA1(Val) A37 N6-methylase TrmN6
LLDWIPNEAEYILDPAVGYGALVQPLSSFNGATVTCIDVDDDVIRHIRTVVEPQFPQGLRTLAADFLQLDFTAEGLLPDRGGFDCIVMNPPFNGRTWVSAPDIDSTWSRIGGRGLNVSLEAAFVLKALTLLKPGGRLLAVLPPSIISGAAARPVREHLLTLGAILAVHELPPFTFERIEARIYLLIFEKQRAASTVTLLNHDLSEPYSREISRDELGETVRLDYRFQEVRLQYEDLINRASSLQWHRLANHVSIERGKLSVPIGLASALHISDFSDGFWHSTRLAKNQYSEPCLGHTEIFMARVGRNAGTAVGMRVGPPTPTTDCVLKIAPHESEHAIAILFALRCVTASQPYIPLLQRSSGGAKYISAADLREVMYPAGLSAAFPEEFEAYTEQLLKRDFAAMSECEHKVLKLLEYTADEGR